MISQKASRKTPLFYGYIIVAAAFVIAAVGDGLLYSFGVFFEPLLKEFGWSRAMAVRVNYF